MFMLRRWLDRLINIAAIMASVVLVAIVMAILADVAGRNLLNAPLRGTQDLMQVALIIIIFGAVAMVDRQDANIAVDLLEPKFSLLLNRSLNLIGRWLGALIFFGIAWAMVDSASISKLLNLGTNILNIPKAPFQYLIAVCSLLTAVSMVLPRPPKVSETLVNEGAVHE
ncbi:TRAP transporter small permease [Salinispirillum marinum]|uniref:TRAP transporter small permease protein n=2 Tax=Saccharospirillaceae TaxID=255527 RepID=A0ABV8BEK7_9GAMM